MEAAPGLQRLEAELAARRQADAGRQEAGVASPRARIEALAEDGFFELAALSTSQLRDAPEGTYGDGVVAGFATVGGRMTAIMADDPLVLPRTDGAVGENKRMRLLAQAQHGELPVVYLADDGGGQQAAFDPANARLLGSYSDRTKVAPGLRYGEREAPHVAVVLGSAAGRNALFAARADVVIGTPEARLASEPGANGSELVDLEVPDEATALRAAARLIALLPDIREPLPRLLDGDAATTLDDAVDPNALSAARLAAGLLDPGAIVFAEEDGGGFATGLGTVDGYPAAYVAAGNGVGGGATLREPHLHRMHRVATLASRYRIPLLMVQHDASYEAASLEEPSFVRALSALLAELHDGSMPKLSVVASRGHVLDDFVLGGRELGTHYIVAWPEAAVGLEPLGHFTREVADAVPPTGPWNAAGHGLVDEIVKPSETRSYLARVIGLLARGRAIATSGGDDTDRRFMPR